MGKSRMRILALGAIGFVLAVAGCSDAGSVSKSIGEVVRGQKLQELRLASVTHFQWDKVYLFQPYTPRPEVCKGLGVQANDCERVVPHASIDDGVMSLAFRSGSRVVRHELHARSNGDFTPIPSGQPISS